MTSFKKNRLKEIFSISKIMAILYFEFSKNFIFQGEQHDFWEFIYVDKGEILIVADKSEYLLKSGELAFHKPDEFHSVRANGTTAPNVVVISFECQSKAMNFFENKILFIDDNEKNMLSHIIKEGKSAFEKFPQKPPITGMKRIKNSPPGSEQMIKLYLELFLIHIFRRHDTILKRERYTLSPQQHFEVKLVDKINAYLNENIYSAITIAKISNYLGVSPSLVKKVYKAQTGESVMDTFIHLKIDEAKRLIREEDLNFSQIAEKLNYGSVHYFSRIFKAKTEMTPTEYSTSVIGTVPKVIMQ